MNCYSIPDEPRFAPLHREAELYLKPARFAAGAVPGAQLHIAVECGEGSEESYSIRRDEGHLTVRGDGIRGAAHGFHHALRLLGFGYSFFADATPRRPELKWPIAGNTLKVNPAFAKRGFLPWGNLLNSTNVWNIEDYQQFLLTTWRWGCNFAWFHNYDFSPLAAFRDVDGSWSHGKPYMDSFRPPCGATPGIRVDEFPLGLAKHFPDAVDGVWAARHSFAADPIAAAQDEFRQVIDFSASLGIDVGFGFHVDGDPSTPGYREQFARRIRHVLETYPTLHTLCLWQPEALGQRGWQGYFVSPGYPALHKRYGQHFAYLDPAVNRVAEGVRLAAIFNMAYEVAKEIKPEINIAFSGWGGDYWLRWGDYFQGLHECLPPDVALGQLDNLVPSWQNTVSESVRSLKGEREAWTTLWVETDGGPIGYSSMWHSQEDLNCLEKLVKSAARLGYRGLFVQNWNTAGVELSSAFVARGGWTPKLSASQFRREYAGVFYGSEDVAGTWEQLEALGAGWTGTSQHTECDAFTWDSFPAISTGELTPGLKRLGDVIQRARQDTFKVAHINRGVDFRINGLWFHCGTQEGRRDAFEELQKLRGEFAAMKLRTPHARRLLATMDFVIAYEHIKRQLDWLGPLELQQKLIRSARTNGYPPDPRLLADYRKGVARIERLWKEVFRAQERRLDTRSDIGTLATIILKAHIKWQEFLKALPMEN